MTEITTPLTAPEPPADLAEPGRRFWARAHQELAFRPPELDLLAEAARLQDRAAEARKSVAQDGFMVAGRYGPKVNPAASAERNAIIAFARILRQLHLTDLPEGEPDDERPWQNGSMGY